MGALLCVDVATDVLPQEALVGEALVAKGAGEGGVHGRGHLAVEVVTKFGVVGEERATNGTSDELLLGVATNVVL